MCMFVLISPEGGGGGGVRLPCKKHEFAGVSGLLCPRVFSLKRSTARAFAVSFRVHSQVVQSPVKLAQG